MNPDSYQNIREEIVVFASQPSVREQLREQVNRLCEMVEKRKEVIRPIEKEAIKQAKTKKGIVRGTPRDGYYFGCEHNTFCKAAEQCGFLHWLPAEPPNPIEWFPGFSVVPLGGELKFRRMKPDEEFMVNAVILASMHDGEMRRRNSHASQFVCHNEPYAGRVFERDNFLMELWRYFVGYSLEKQTQLELALQNVKDANKAEPQHLMATKVKQATKTEDEREPPDNPPPVGKRWSKPMTKADIVTALHIDSVHKLNTMVRANVYEVVQAGNRQVWKIRIDNLDNEIQNRLT